MTASGLGAATRRPPNPTPWPAIAGSIRNSVRSVLAYRLDFVMSLLGLLAQVVLLNVVWRAVYGGASTVSGISQGQSTSYALLAACFQTALMPWQFSALTQRVRTGQVGVDMMRPLGLIPQVLAQNVGATLARLPITAVGIVWAVAIGGLSLPPSPETAVAWVISTVLGFSLTLLMNLLMSMTAFWSLETSGYQMLYRLGTGLLSGVLIPLWFMPNWLASGLNWLPFRAQMYTPLSIYFGHARGGAAWLAIALQLIWLGVVSVVLWFVWRRALHKVVVLGG